MQYQQISELIDKLGLPIVGLLFVGWGFWKIIKWLQVSLTDKIDMQQNIIVQLIDRIRVLQTDILKLDTMIRVKYGLEVDEQRIERSNDPKYDKSTRDWKQ
jgi:hypothetical protein